MRFLYAFLVTFLGFAFGQDLSTPGQQSVSVTFRSDPIGALVYVSDTFVGHTPVRVRLNASTNTKYRVAPRGGNYGEFEGTLNFSSDETINVYLPRLTPAVPAPSAEPLAGSPLGMDLSTPGGRSILVTFTSEPAGGEVYVSDTFIGTTPVSVRLNFDTQTAYRVTLDGHEPIETTLRLRSDETININFASADIAPESASINVTPAQDNLEGAKAFVESYFEGAIRRGESGYHLWCQDSVSQLMRRAFFAPRQYEILNAISFTYLDPNGVVVSVRVHSSNAGGMPIISDYAIHVHRPGGQPCVSAITERN